VIVSTEPLAERLAGLNRNVIVVPNQLDETLYSDLPPSPPADDSTTVIGYMGTYSHFDDLMMIVHPLRRLLASHSGIRLEFVGVAERSELLAIFPGAEVRVLDVPSSAVRYPEFTAWMQKNLRWDLAIAPLEMTEFTRSKSDIKMLDYGILGIPGIFSQVPAYERTVRHEVTGLLVPNAPEAWEDALARAAKSSELRRSMSVAVCDEVRSSRSLRQHATEWPDAIGKLLAAAKNERRLPVPRWTYPR
jgi:glycosyltransferase involved in cell wall biosynthesis